jgi:hypothetical protein
VGKSRSGKTTLAAAFLYYDYAKRFKNIYWLCSTLFDQDTFLPLQQYIKKDLVWTHATDENITKLLTKHYELGKKKSLIVIDDQTAEAAINRGSKGLWAKMIYDLRWMNLSMLVMTHRISGVTVALRENLEHLIVLDLGNRKQLSVLEEEFNFMETKKEFVNLYRKEISNTEFGTLHFNLIPPICVYKQCRDNVNAILLCSKMGRSTVHNSAKRRNRDEDSDSTGPPRKRLRISPSGPSKSNK